MGTGRLPLAAKSSRESLHSSQLTSFAPGAVVNGGIGHEVHHGSRHEGNLCRYSNITVTRTASSKRCYPATKIGLSVQSAESSANGFPHESPCAQTPHGWAL